MVNPVSQSNPVPYVSPNQQVNHPAPAKPSANQPTEPTPKGDTVQLSSAAKGASGDVDHDGDSH